MSVRERLKEHTNDLIRPRWDQHKVTLGNLVTTVHNPDASDAQAEAAALAFLEEWGGHVVYRKTARYGLILHTMRHRPEVADMVDSFDKRIRHHLGYDGLECWYRHFTGVRS